MGLIFLTLVVLYFLIITPEVSYYQAVHSKFNGLMISGKTANDHSFYSFIFCFGMIWVYLGSLLLSTRHLIKQKRKNKCKKNNLERGVYRFGDLETK